MRSTVPSDSAFAGIDLIIDPGFGFGKTAEHNLELLRRLDVIGLLGRPVLLGASRKSTLGKVLDLPADRAGRGDPRDDGPRDRGRRGHHPSPRRPTERPRGPDDRRSRTRDMATTRARGIRRMTDRIVLANMQFQGRHGYYEHERVTAQPFEVDVELLVTLAPAAIDDDLGQTIDYGQVYEAVRQIVESMSFKLLEALAEKIAQELLTKFPVPEVGVRVRKPKVQLGGPLDYAGVEIWRRRSE